jgi:hypothetical protein
MRKAYQCHLAIFQENASDPNLTSVQFATLRRFATTAQARRPTASGTAVGQQPSAGSSSASTPAI